MPCSASASQRLLRRLACLTLLALVLSLLPTVGQPTSAQQRFRTSLPLVATAAPAPRIEAWAQLGSSVVARPGDRVRLNLFIRNTRQVEVRGVTLRVPFDRDLADFFTYHIDESRGDRFLGVTGGNTVGLEVNRRIGPGKTYSVSLWFTARQSAPEGARLALAADYAFGAQTGRTNLTTTYIYRQGEVSGGFCGPYRGVDGKFTVTPETAVQGLTFRFVSDCFLPGEEVTTWLNIGSGTQPLALRARADAGGRVFFQLDSRTLTPADSYGLVARGHTSGLSVLGPFIVSPARAATASAARAEAPDAPAWPPTTLSTAQAASGSIVGSVTGDGGAPLAEVVVTLFDGESDRVVDSTRTDAAGAYTLTGVADGSYTIAFLASFSGEPVAAYASQARPLSLSGGQTVREDVHLSRGGFVTGRVLAAGPAQTPLEGVSVFFLTGGTRLAGVALTDATGVYTSTALPGGAYSVLFDPTRSAVVSATTYLPASAGAAVIPPGTRTGVDAVLEPNPAVIRLGGRVIAQDTGLPLSDVVVVIREATLGGFVDYEVTDTLGFYQSSLLPPGRYRAEAITARSSEAASRAYQGASSDQVIEQTVGGIRNDVNFTLTRGTQMSGMITAADTGLPLAGVQVRVLDAGGRAVALGVTDAAGGYRTSAVGNGSYTVLFSTAYNERPDAVGYLDLTRPITVSASPEPLTGLDAALEPWPFRAYLPATFGATP